MGSAVCAAVEVDRRTLLSSVILSGLLFELV